MKKRQSLSWVPELNGAIYCSPACGGRCTYAAFQRACQDAERLKARLGSGWRGHVHENLGWHYRVCYGPLSVHVSRTRSGRRTYFCLLADDAEAIDGHGSILWSDPKTDYPTARAAIKAQLRRAEDVLARLHGAIRAAGGFPA